MKTLTIRDWYVMTYPDDELGYEIDPKANFLGLKETLAAFGDVYAYIGVGDSVVRERVFEKAARVYGVSYDRIYNLWLEGGRVQRAEHVRRILGAA